MQLSTTSGSVRGSVYQAVGGYCPDTLESSVEQKTELCSRRSRVRVVFAGLFVFAGMAGGIIILSPFLPHAPVWLFSILMILLFFGLTIAALILFNSPGGWRRKKQD